MFKLWNRYSLLNKIILNHVFVGRTQTYPQRILSTKVPSEPREDTDILSYVDISHEFKSGITNATRKLEKFFAMTKRQAVNIVAKNKFLTEVPGKVMTDNYKLCQENGIKDETILSCLFLLGERFLFEKVYILQNLNYDLDVLAPLLKLNVLILSTAVKYGNLLERISFFSKIFKMSEYTVCKCIVKRPFLLSLNLERTEIICQLLFGYGINRREILNDLWVLRYSTHVIKERIEYAKSQNVEKLKTWMIRGNLDIFDKYIQRKSEYKLMLGDNTLAEYLSKKLDCTIDQARGLVVKYPALEKRNLKKLQEIIEFIYQKGFLPEDIIRSPKILFFSVDTIKKRLNQVEECKWHSVGLHVFVKSQKQFNEYCETMNKSKKHKNKQQL